MESIIVDFLNNFSYLSVFILLFVECIFPPIPSEIVLLTAGTIVNTLDKSFILMLFFATLGGYIGAIVLYFVGYFFNQDKMTKIVEKKWIKKLGFKKSDVDKTYLTFNRFGSLFVFFGRMVPIVRSLISIPAGSARINFFKFSILTIFGNIIWNTILLLIGYSFAGAITTVLYYLDVYKYIVIIIVILVVVIKLIIKRIKVKSQ